MTEASSPPDAPEKEYDYDFPVGNITVDTRDGVPTRATLTLITARDPGDPPGLMVPVRLAGYHAMYAGWAMVIGSGMATSMGRLRDPSTAGLTAEDRVNAQNNMAAVLTDLHRNWLASGDTYAESMLTNIVPLLLRSMAATCTEMADELETEGVTRFVPAGEKDNG